MLLSRFRNNATMSVVDAPRTFEDLVHELRQLPFVDVVDTALCTIYQNVVPSVVLVPHDNMHEYLSRVFPAKGDDFLKPLTTFLHAGCNMFASTTETLFDEEAKEFKNETTYKDILTKAIFATVPSADTATEIVAQMQTRIRTAAQQEILRNHSARIRAMEMQTRNNLVGLFKCGRPDGNMTALEMMMQALLEMGGAVSGKHFTSAEVHAAAKMIVAQCRRSATYHECRYGIITNLQRRHLDKLRKMGFGVEY
jgi:hypothetical protein